MEVMSWTKLWSMLVLVVSCLVMSSIWRLTRFVMLSAILEVLVFLIRNAEAQIPFLTGVGTLLEVLS